MCSSCLCFTIPANLEVLGVGVHVEVHVNRSIYATYIRMKQRSNHDLVNVRFMYKNYKVIDRSTA